MADIVTPKETFQVEYEGAPVLLRAGVTRVRAGHPIMNGNESRFEHVSDHVDYEVDETHSMPRNVRASVRRAKSE